MKEVRVCEAMKSLVGTLSDGTVLHQQDGGAESRQVRVCGAMKAPVGLLSDGTVCVSRWRNLAPTSSTQVSVEDEIRKHRLTDTNQTMISGGHDYEV